MSYFDIKYINYETTVDEVVAAFNTENDGPGQLFGYRALHKKLCEQDEFAVPRGLVYDVMMMECPEGLERRKNVGKRKRKRGPVGTFTSLVCVKKKTLQQKIHLVIFWVPEAHGNCNLANQLTKIDESDLFLPTIESAYKTIIYF